MNMLKIGRPSVSKAKALEQISQKEEIIKMNINVSKSFHKEIKFFALKQDITVTNLVHKALQIYMKI